MLIKEGKIIPGECISPFFIGMSSDKLISILAKEYLLEKRTDGVFVISVENAKFFFNREKILYQIGVSYGFKSKYEGKIGIGDTMTDVINSYKSYSEEDDIYFIEGIDNLSFELSDYDGEDEWNELIAPIEWIWVYNMNVKFAPELSHSHE